MACENIHHRTQSILHQVFAAATEHASIAMSRWTNGQVTLALDEVHEVLLESLSEELELDDELLTLIVLNIEGACGGQLILTFDEYNGRQLAASLLQRPAVAAGEWSRVEQSALMETGNILGSAYLNELTRLTNQQLLPSAPYFIQDYAASVVEQAVLPQAMSSNSILMVRTRFDFNHSSVGWNVLFVPSSELLETLHREFAGVLESQSR